MNKRKAEYLRCSLRIQPRDRNILRFVHRFRLTTIRQLHKALFGDKKRITCYRRVRMLQSEKYLKCYQLTHESQKIFQITVKGCTAAGIVDESLLKKGEQNRVYNSQVAHDLGLVNIAIALETLPHVTFKTENEVRSTHDVEDEHFIPDGLMMASRPVSFTLGIEFERNLRTYKQYEERFSYMRARLDYYKKYVYVLEDIKLRDYIVRIIPKITEDDYLDEDALAALADSLLFVEYKDLIDNPFDCSLYTMKGNILTFRKLFEALFQVQKRTPLIPPSPKAEYKRPDL